ncbi:unnamed protein product [Polarella glacialis]|uniref:Uncharacterized protein n=1 Tax=Polarella glacialis TaxID=89957 RepID=A0A813IHQ4_POLGL|nr:unnamed protein product [Polarella glacialis]
MLGSVLNGSATATANIPNNNNDNDHNSHENNNTNINNNNNNNNTGSEGQLLGPWWQPVAWRLHLWQAVPAPRSSLQAAGPIAWCPHFRSYLTRLSGNYCHSGRTLHSLARVFDAAVG